MKIGILHQDGVAELSFATIYKIQIISQECTIANAIRYSNWSTEDYSNFENEQAITFIGDISNDNQLVVNIAGLLIEFPEPINSIQVVSGAILVYYDEFSPIPEEYR